MKNADNKGRLILFPKKIGFAFSYNFSVLESGGKPVTQVIQREGRKITKWSKQREVPN